MLTWSRLALVEQQIACSAGGELGSVQAALVSSLPHTHTPTHTLEAPDPVTMINTRGHRIKLKGGRMTERMRIKFYFYLLSANI